MTSGYPQLDKYIMSKMGQTANQYPGPVSTQINPLMTNAANLMSMYGTGQPYQAPGYNTYGSMMGQYPPPAGGGGGQQPTPTTPKKPGSLDDVMALWQQFVNSRLGQFPK